MNKILIFLGVILLFLTNNKLYAQYSETELQSIFLELLSDKGIEDGWIDSDGDVQFTYNNHHYFIEVNEDDNEFFRLVMFNIWEIESVAEYQQVLNAVDLVNREKKVVKGYINNGDNVDLATEMFIASPYHVEDVFMRCLESIELAVDVFVESM